MTTLPYRYTDPDGDTINIGPGDPDDPHDPNISIGVTGSVYVPLDQINNLINAIRAAHTIAAHRAGTPCGGHCQQEACKVSCIHGYVLGQDSCDSCDQLTDRHTPQYVTVTPSWSDEARPMCRVCGRSANAYVHRENTP